MSGRQTPSAFERPLWLQAVVQSRNHEGQECAEVASNHPNINGCYGAIAALHFQFRNYRCVPKVGSSCSIINDCYGAIAASDLVPD